MRRVSSTRWTSVSISRWASRIRYCWPSSSRAAICCWTVASCASARASASSKRRSSFSTSVGEDAALLHLDAAAQVVGDARRRCPGRRRRRRIYASVDPLVEPAVDQRRQRRQRRLGVGARRRDVDLHPAGRHQGQQAHDALAVGLLAVLARP